MTKLQQWWNEPDQFDWTAQFLVRRGYVRQTQIVMAFVSTSSALVAFIFVTSLRLPAYVTFTLAAVGAIFTTAMATFWLTRWPTKRQSEIAITLGVLYIPAWSIAQPNTAVALLACTATAVTGGYIAFFHSSRLMVFNFAVALFTAAWASWRLARETDVTAAVSAFWLIWLLNTSVPLAIRSISRAMGTYAIRSDTDPLTGLLNRRGFTDTISRQVAQPRGLSHLALVMVDVDDFKSVNDTHGHAAGDDALQAIADLLRQHSPPGAAICRAGGEEFLIGVAAEPLAADLMAARVCSAIAEMPHRVTASIGISHGNLDEIPSSDATAFIDVLIAAADAAMYLAKRDGGNQIKRAEA